MYNDAPFLSIKGNCFIVECNLQILKEKSDWSSDIEKGWIYTLRAFISGGPNTRLENQNPELSYMWITKWQDTIENINPNIQVQVTSKMHFSHT